MPQRSINTGIWTLPDVDGLPKDAKLLYIYLQANNHTSQAGVYRISLDRIASETKIPVADLPQLLDQLKPLDITWCPQKQRVWVKFFLKEQGHSPLFLKAAIRILRDVEPDLLEEYLSYNKAMGVQLPMELNGEGIDTVWEGSRKGIDTVSIPPLTEPKSKSLSNNGGRGGGEEQTTKTVDIVTLFNELCPSLPKVVHLNGTNRKAKLLARLRDHPETDWWRQYFRKVAVSPLLSGQDGKWRATFDWLLEPRNMVKVLEGNYDNTQGTGGPGARTLPSGQDLRRGW
jgi:hypothetical protein